MGETKPKLTKSQRNLKWKKENPEKVKEYNEKYRSKSESKEKIRAWHYKEKYGITIDEYNFLLEKQRGVCSLCSLPERFRNRRLAVDHCHTTGRVRGLLCQDCNTALGKFKENIEVLGKAIKYLEGRL